MSAAALAHLYEQHRGPVLGALAVRCPWVAPVDRESLYHDAYTAVLERERIGTLEPEWMHPRELRAYLVKAAIHKALDERKSSCLRGKRWRCCAQPNACGSQHRREG